MYSPLDCPDVECWQLLLGDTVPPDQRASFERHLESCRACQERLDRAAELGETLRGLAREVGDPTLAPPDPTPARVLERLPEARSPLATAPAATELPFLARAGRPGLLGTLGPYEVEEVIGQGGMGVVLKSFDPGLQRHVAIKVLAPRLATSPTARRRFTREAQAAAAVRHENVVAVHGVYEAEGLPYLVMQYVAGESLQARLDRAGPLEPAEVVRLGYETASGLAAAHAQGLIHRDIKPANLLLEGGRAKVKITDFGLARLVDDVGLTQAGVVAGTPEYMAPEQARGEAVDHRADLFSLGSVLYAGCTGLSPFDACTTLAVLRRVRDESPAPLRALNPDVPAWLEALIGRLLAKDPAERLQTAAEVAALLGSYLAHLRQPATVPAPELPPPTAGACPVLVQPGRVPGAIRRGERRWLPVALALLATLGMGMALLLAGAGDPTPPADKEWKVFRQDFRGQTVNDRFWNYAPPDAEQQIKEEAEGLRIRLPEGDGGDRWRAIGLLTRFRVHGDCEITLSYELLRADRPLGGKSYAAVGVSLAAVADTPGKEKALLARFHRVDGPLYLCQKIFTDAEQKRQYSTRVFPTEARSGRLRLVRRGDTFTCLVADAGAGEFRELHQFQLVRTDLANVGVAAETQSNPVDVRIRDFEVRAEDLPTLEEPAPHASDVAPRPARKGWLAAAVLLGLAGTVVLGVFVWLRGLHGRRAGKAQVATPPPGRQLQPVAGVPSVAVVCASCGKPLKARAELAGKWVKCPKCRKPVLVPGPGTDEVDRTPS
jgi:serine/threonine protein kinase